ncbi:MAG: Hsp20/alpha crystallin family protein [Limisphaerales bacterium]
MKSAKSQGNKKGALVPVSRGGAPFWPLQRWQREIDRLFGNPFGDWLMSGEPFMEDWMPPINLYEEQDKFVIEAELPGIKKEEIQIFMSGNNLNITGQRTEEREQKARDTHRAERCFGRFHRMVSLPVPVKADAIQARYRDGVLTVTCPKTEEARRKEVRVQVE